MTDTLIRSAPIRFDPSFESPEPDEAETTAEMVETLRSIAQKTYDDGGHGLRSVHAKSHGLLRGTLEVANDLPSHLAQGLFAEDGEYDVVARLSTTPGDLLADSVSTPRGFAFKVLDVPGAQLSGRAADTTQDFVMVNGPAFQSPTGKSFLRSLKLLAVTTDRAPNLKKALSAVLRGAERVLESVGGESGTLKGLGGHPETHILGETFFTVEPVRYGDHIAKLSLVPRSDNLRVLAGAALDVNGHPDGLRDAVLAFFAREAFAEWDLKVQLNTNIETMPVEDATVVWPVDESPYETVARLHMPRQVAWSEARSRAVDDGMAFNPWHGLVAHQPLGSIMRVRRAAYEASSAFRAQRNGSPLSEPHTLDGFPD